MERKGQGQQGDKKTKGSEMPAGVYRKETVTGLTHTSIPTLPSPPHPTPHTQDTRSRAHGAGQTVSTGF